MEDENIGGFIEYNHAGWYEVNNNLMIAFEERPLFFHRLMTKIFLGWKWIDKT